MKRHARPTGPTQSPPSTGAFYGQKHSIGTLVPVKTPAFPSWPAPQSALVSGRGMAAQGRRHQHASSWDFTLEPVDLTMGTRKIAAWPQHEGLRKASWIHRRRAYRRLGKVRPKLIEREPWPKRIWSWTLRESATAFRCRGVEPVMMARSGRSMSGASRCRPVYHYHPKETSRRIGAALFWPRPPAWRLKYDPSAITRSTKCMCGNLACATRTCRDDLKTAGFTRQGLCRQHAGAIQHRYLPQGNVGHYHRRGRPQAYARCGTRRSCALRAQLKSLDRCRRQRGVTENSGPAILVAHGLLGRPIYVRQTRALGGRRFGPDRSAEDDGITTSRIMAGTTERHFRPSRGGSGRHGAAELAHQSVVRTISAEEKSFSWGDDWGLLGAGAEDLTQSWLRNWPERGVSKAPVVGTYSWDAAVAGDRGLESSKRDASIATYKSHGYGALDRWGRRRMHWTKQPSGAALKRGSTRVLRGPMVSGSPNQSSIKRHPRPTGPYFSARKHRAPCAGHGGRHQMHRKISAPSRSHRWATRNPMRAIFGWQVITAYISMARPPCSAWPAMAGMRNWNGRKALQDFRVASISDAGLCSYIPVDTGLRPPDLRCAGRVEWTLGGQFFCARLFGMWTTAMHSIISPIRCMDCYPARGKLHAGLRVQATCWNCIRATKASRHPRSGQVG